MRFWPQPAAAVVEGDPLAAIYPLQIIMPREAGTAPSGIAGAPNFPTGHAHLWAMPGEVYNRQARVLGGMPPYTFWITGGTGDIAVDAWGVITMSVGSVSNGTEYTQTLHVTDAHGTEVTSEWTITVDSTKFIWLDPAGADGNAGTKASPYGRLPRIHSTFPGANFGSKIAILRGGNYNFNGMWTTNLVARTVISANSAEDFVLSGTQAIVEGNVIQFLDGPNAGLAGFVEGSTGGLEGGNYRVNAFHGTPFTSTPGVGDTVGWNPSSNGRIEWRPDLGSCIQWIGYEGETATVDFGFAGITTDRGVLIRPWSDGNNPAYIDNLNCVNAWIGAFEHTNGGGGGAYTQYRRLRPNGACPSYAVDGANPAFIMQNATGTSWFFQAADIVPILSGGPNGGQMGAAIIKCYNQQYPEYQRLDSRGQSHTWDLKSAHEHYECKFNRYRASDDGQGGIWGNMNGSNFTGVHYYSVVDMRDAPNLLSLALDCGQDGFAAETWYLQITFIGRVQCRNILSGDGPVHFKRCVKIVHPDDTSQPGHVFRFNSTDALIDYEDDLNGVLADGYVDSNGLLTGSARTTHGPGTAKPKGHEIPGLFT